MLAVMYARSLFCFCLLLYLKLVGFFSLGSPSRSVGTAGCKSAASIGYRDFRGDGDTAAPVNIYVAAKIMRKNRFAM
jgi:hypothetical protein